MGFQQFSAPKMGRKAMVIGLKVSNKDMFLFIDDDPN